MNSFYALGTYMQLPCDIQFAAMRRCVNSSQGIVSFAAMSQSNTGAVAFMLILAVPTFYYLALFKTFFYIFSPDMSFRDEGFLHLKGSAFGDSQSLHIHEDMNRYEMFHHFVTADTECDPSCHYVLIILTAQR